LFVIEECKNAMFARINDKIHKWGAEYFRKWSGLTLCPPFTNYKILL
jgi:hypothetical protein